jgi:hypothetical protein
VQDPIESPVPVILPVARLDPEPELTESARVTPEPTTAGARDVVPVPEPTPTDRIPSELPSTPPAAPEAPQPQAAWPAPPRTSPSRVRFEAAQASDDMGYLGMTVQEVADSAIERLRDAENATLQHLAALEAEAIRRAEMLTAQAELDAELIRITARREAHAIISAARAQAGAGAPPHRDTRQLNEISDAMSRFAESLESSIAPMRSPAAHPEEPS